MAHHTALFDITGFEDNLIRNSGPLLLLTDPIELQICCGSSSICLSGDRLAKALCITGSHRSQRTFGTFTKTVSISPLVIRSYSSGEMLPSLNVTLLDAFANTAPEQATLVVSEPDDSVELSGSPVVGMVINGAATVTGITLRARPGVYKLNITVVSKEAGIKIVTKTVYVTVRECRIGEITIRNNTGCLQCQPNFYNFNPNNTGCGLCPKNKARCDGAALAPLDHFWHNSSHSDALVRCLNENACKYPNRTSILMNKARENITMELTWNNGYPLCHEVRFPVLKSMMFYAWQFQLQHVLWFNIHVTCVEL